MNQATLSDEELMIRVREDDFDQLVPLFDRYQKPMFNFFLRLTSDTDASEDLVQNLFIRIMKYRSSYRSEHKFRTWIYQMGRNLFYDHYRKEVKTREGFMNVDKVNFEPFSAHEEYEVIEGREQKLRMAMNQLSDDKRELLVMSKFQGMKYEEIAKVTDMTVSNVKVKVHRAINSLREIYFQTSEL